MEPWAAAKKALTQYGGAIKAPCPECRVSDLGR